MFGAKSEKDDLVPGIGRQLCRQYVGAKGQRSDETCSTENWDGHRGCFLSTKQWGRWQLPPRDSHRDASPYTPCIAPVEQKRPCYLS